MPRSFRTAKLRTSGRFHTVSHLHESYNFLQCIFRYSFYLVGKNTLCAGDTNRERSSNILNTDCVIHCIHARRPTYVNRGDGRASNHIPDVVHLAYGRRARRRGRQHHLARHPRLFSTTVSPRKAPLGVASVCALDRIRVAGIQIEKIATHRPSSDCGRRKFA